MTRDSDRITDQPTGAPEESRPRRSADAPPLPPDQAGSDQGGNVTTHRGPGPAEDAGRDDPARHVTPEGNFGATTAEDVVGSLHRDWRHEKGSDPGSPLAGLLAAGAMVESELSEADYRRLRASHPEWPSVDDLARDYGSFGAALQAAGIRSPDRTA